MEKIQITKMLLRQDLNTKPLRNRIQQYNASLGEECLLKDKKQKKEFKKLKKRFRTRDGRTKFAELKELEKRGFF